MLLSPLKHGLHHMAELLVLPRPPPVPPQARSASESSLDLKLEKKIRKIQKLSEMQNRKAKDGFTAPVTPVTHQSTSHIWSLRL